MKKSFSIGTMSLVLVLVLSACGGSGQSGFETYIKSGDYDKAITEYRENISGNSEKENSAKTFVANYLNESLANFANGTATENDTQNVIDCLMKVDDATYILNVELGSATELFTIIQSSKEHYASATAYMEQAEYEMVIDACLNVYQQDSENYNAAQELLANARAKLQEEFHLQIDAAIAEKKYAEVITMYESAEYIDKSDSKLIEKIDFCKAQDPITLMGVATLQYPSQNDTWKYNVYDYYIEITGYVGNGEKDRVVLPAEIDGLPVWKVGANALRGLEISSIQLPDCLQMIGPRAFGESKIETITMPKELYAIGQEAFWRCKNLSSISIPQGIKIIAAETFSDCENLLEVVLPETVYAIEKRAFENCKKLTAITLPDSITQIGACAFLNCANLTSIEIPGGVKEIEQSAFGGCTSLTQVHLEEGLEMIGAGAFHDCESLAAIVLPKSVVSIGTNEWNMPPFADVADSFDLTVLNPDMNFTGRIFDNRNGSDSRVGKTIHGYAGSTAAQYCADCNITFQLIE